MSTPDLLFSIKPNPPDNKERKNKVTEYQTQLAISADKGWGKCLFLPQRL